MTITFTGGLSVQGQVAVAINLAPVWVSAENLGSNHEATTITAAGYVLVATDADSLTYSYVSGTLPTGATINANGTITGPAVSVASDTTFNFTARVTDGVTPVDKAFNITVNLNESPVWSTAADLGSVDELAPVNIQLTATDADSLPLTLTYSVVSGALPSGVTLNTATGLLTGTAPDESSDTLYMFTVRASDGLDTADRQFSLTVTDIPVLSDHTLWAWGNNSWGQLGDGTTTYKNSPIQVGALTNWGQISTQGSFPGGGIRGFTHAVKTDNTLWAWGAAQYGYLGDGTTVYKNSPVQLGALTTWNSVKSGMYHSHAIKTDGALWGWGINLGRIGDGTTTYRSSPVQIGALTDWALTAGSRFATSAIKTDGTLWGWGIGTYGEVGDGTTTTRSSPVQIGSLTNWSSIESGKQHVMAVKTDGTLWAWGDATVAGQLGLGNTTSYSSPVQVGALTDWAKVNCGDFHTIATKTDGTLWAWGTNASGELGDGSTTVRSSPVQIGSLTTWSKISAGRYHSAAVKTDGTLWSWGDGINGRTGHGNTTDYSSPVQVGALTDWDDVRAGRSHTVALRTA